MGNEYYTTEGLIAGGKFYPKGGGKPEQLAKFDVKVTPGGRVGQLHRRRPQPQVDDLQRRHAEGPLLRRLCHLANISYRLGENVPFNAKTRSSATTARSSRRSRI